MSGKKSVLRLSALALALSLVMVRAEAAVPADNNLIRIIPEVKQRFEFSLAAIALQPAATNLNYVIYNKALPIQMPRWTEKELTPGYAFGFELGARYLYPEGQDIGLDWTHTTNNTSASETAPTSQFFLGPDYEIGPNANTIRNATGSAEFKYDVVNLTVGQSLQFGRHVGMRFFGGISDGFLREQVKSTYFGMVATGDFAGPYQTQQIVTANFNGIGPRLGLDGSYHCDNGFGIFGEGAASALIGASYAKTAFNSASPQMLQVFGVTNNFQSISDKRIAQVVPGFDAKLGVGYKRLFNNSALLKLEAGYQAAVYINAINQYLPGTLVDQTSLALGGIFVATMNHTLSNYSVQGPFLKAELSIV